MPHLSRELQAERAIAHTLQNIAERPPVAYYLGLGTQTYALLIESLATLSGNSMDYIQGIYKPAQPHILGPDELATCPFCGSSFITKCETSIDHAFECQDCSTVGPEGDTEDEARAKWNKRQMPR